ncbi:MAG: SET domain-containing protein-lysine N-methyltransferase [archaeon]|jgi:hypothetical protein
MHKDKYEQKSCRQKSFFEKEFFLDESSSPKVDDFLKKEFLIKSKSPIHGTGVFTKIAIPHGEVFYLIPLNNISPIFDPLALRIPTGNFVSDEKVLNFVNHSCEANSEIVLEQQRVVLRAKRTIAPGEEITLDYTVTEEKKNLVPCNCKSQKCRSFFFTS